MSLSSKEIGRIRQESGHFTLLTIGQAAGAQFQVTMPQPLPASIRENNLLKTSAGLSGRNKPVSATGSRRMPDQTLVSCVAKTTPP